MKKNTARRVIGTAMLAAAVLVFTACPREIGLGSAVDTQKPVIAITAPEADSHISGEFTLTGTVSDDLAVKGVTVTFSSTSQSSLPAKTYPAVIDKEKGTWSLSIDSINVTTGLPDSNYEIIATATDTTNKTATAARSVQIDNTAPTVLVTSPSLYGDGKRTKFCSQLEIKGEAYDASKIEYVKIYICNAEGEVVAGPIEADGTNTWSALFSSDDLSGLEDNGTYFFYPVAEDESGNTNSIFYHKADIYGLPNSTNPFPSTNDIGHLDQGTAPSSSCRLSAEDLFTVRIGANADSVAEGSTSEKGYPDFTYQSQADAAILWTNLEGEGASGNIGVGSAIFATIQPPSDNSAILLDTIEIKIRVRAEGDEEPGSWIIQPSTTKQKVGESVNIAIYPKTTDNAETALSLPVGRYEINLSCRTNSNAEIGSSIVFVVQSDAPVIEESAFGDTPSAAFAQGIISGKNGSTTGLSGKFLQSDYSVIPTSNFDSNSLKIVCKDSSGEEVETYQVGTEEGSDILYDPADGSWSLTIPAGSWGAGMGCLVDGTYTYTIEGKMGDISTTITRIVTVDTIQPVVTLTYPADGGVISGTELVFQGNAMDSGTGVTAAYWCIDDEDATYTVADIDTENASDLYFWEAPEKGTWYTFSMPTSFNNTTVDLTGFEEKKYKVFVYAVDGAGYGSELTENTFCLDNSNPELRELSVTVNGLTTNENFQLAGTAWDTNGLESLTVSDGTHTWTSAGTDPSVSLTKKTADPGEDEENWNWSINFATGESTEGIHLDDGSVTFTITAKDVAGKTATASRSVTIDTSKPVMASAALQNDIVKCDESVYNRLSVSASDSGTGLAGVYYQIASSKETVPSFASESGWEALALGGSGWTGNVDFSDKPEGVQYVYVAAKDNVGNKIVKADPLIVTVDKQKPVTTVTGATDTGSTDVTLTVRVTDTNPRQPVITVTDTTGAQMTAPGLTVTDKPSTATYREWEVAVPFSTDAYATDGVYKIFVNEIDANGRMAVEVVHEIRKDTTAPAINRIDAPEAGKTGVNALYGTTYLFRGTAKDTASGLDCAGLAKILYAFTHDDVEPAAADYTALSMTDGTWTLTKDLVSGTADTAEGSLHEGSWSLYVLAEDKAGNRTATPAVCRFDIDMSDPVLSITAPADATQTSYTKENSFVMTGTASDTNSIQSFTVRLGNGSAVPVTVGTDGTWTYTVSKTEANKDQLISAKFTATDVAGKTTEKTVPFYFDTQAPSVTITLPAANETTINNVYTLTGTVADTGAGVDTATASYIIKKGSTEVASGALSVTGTSWRADDVSLGTEEGLLSLTVSITDNLGWSTEVERNFYYDQSNPELRVLSISANGFTATDDFQLAGTAWDTNELESITVSDGTTTWTSTGASPAVTLTKKTADPGIEEADWNWGITFGTGESTSGVHIADGTTTFTITVKDVAGKSVSATRTVTVDTIHPAITEASVQNAMVKLDESVYNRFTVTASDPAPAAGISGTGLAGVYYKLVTSNAAAPSFASESGWEALALGSDGWTGNVDFTGKAEGTHYIYVAAKDNAGNKTVTETPVTVTVDAYKPVISATGASDASAADVNLTVRVTDTNPSEPQVKILDEGNNELTVNGVTLTAGATTASYKEWTLTVPFSTATYAEDGVYTVIINETDTRGRTAAAVTHPIRKDTTAPAVNVIGTPSTDTEKTGVNALYGTTYVFRGTAKDKDDGTECSGLAKILYAFTQAGTAPALADYTEQAASDGNWSISKTLNSGKSAETGTDNLYEGSWRLYVLAEDKAGNRSATPAVRAFDIDMSAPVLEISKADGTALTDLTKTYYTDGDSVVFEGLASDTNGIQSLTVKIDDGTAVPVTVGTDGNWTYTAETVSVTADRLHTAEFLITDVAGKTTDMSVPFYFDTQAPSVTITLPAANETTINNTYTLSGTVADTGVGVDADNATYIIRKGSTTVASGALTVTGASWRAENVSLGTGEGELSLTVTIKDKLGWSTDIVRTFYYDLSNPELREFSVSANGLTANDDFQLAGTAWDTNELDCITVSDGTNTWTSDGASPAVSLTKKTSDPGTAVADRNWHIDFGVGSSTSGIHISDGTTTFTITVKDVAGKMSSLARTVTVDTTAPSISSATVQNAMTKLDESVYNRLTVTATDPDPSTGVNGTGLAGVYYKVVSTNTAPAFTTDSGWESLALGSDGWTGNVDFSGKDEGTHYIFTAAKDNAGNRTVYGTAASVVVDKQKPVIAVSGAADAGATNVLLTVRVTDTNPVAPVITVLDTDGNEMDEPGLSIEEVTVVATYKEWTVTVPFSSSAYATDGVYSIVVNETDTRGRAATAVTKTIRRDTTAPAVNTIDGPVAGKTGVNALYGTSYLFQGTAKDLATGTNCAGLAKIWYAFTNSSTAPTAGPGADGTPYVEMTMTDGSWTISKTLNTGTSATGNLYEGKWYLYVLAEDKAGNRSSTPVSRAFDIDMSAPSLSITSPTGTYTAGANVIISGTASDTNGIAVNGSDNKYVTVRVGSAAPVEATVDEYGNWSYTYEKTDDNKDQLLTATVTVTDTVGKTTEKEVQIYFDSQSPTITIVEPGDGEVKTSGSCTVSGTISDIGSGIAKNTVEDIAEYAAAGTTAGRKAEIFNAAKATYVIKSGESTVAKGLLTITGSTWSTGTVALGNDEGTLDITITMKDGVGNESEGTRSFYYDKALPVISETGVGSNLTTGTAFTFSGTASDTNALYAVNASGVAKNAITISGTKSDGTTAFTDKTIDVAANGTWTQTFTPGTGSGQLADGTYSFTFTVKDVANRTKSTTRNVTIDTVAPTITAASASAAGEVPAGKVYLDVSGYKQLTVTANDDATGTGLAGVYYKVQAASAAAPTFTSDTDWTSLALGSSGWTANIDFSSNTEGDWKIYVAAKDNAGNRTLYTETVDEEEVAKAVAITVDATKPVITVEGASDAKSENVVLTVHIADTNPATPTFTVKEPKADGSADGTALSAQNAALTVTGPVTEEGGKKWTVTVPFGNANYNKQGVYSIVVNETDTRGRAATAVTKTIRRDTTAPAVNTIDGPVAGKTGVNALYGTSYLFQGTAKDLATGTNCAGLAKIWYAFTNSSTAPTAGPGADGTPYVEMTMTDGSWTISKTLNEGTSAAATGNLYEGKWYLYVLAEDKAGNRSSTPVSRAFDIDMSAPSLSITAPTGTYTAGANVIISGTASDTNGIALNGSGNKYVTVRVGSAAPVEATVDEYGNWSYTYEKTDDNKDQLLTAAVTVTDTVGKTATSDVQFFFDTQAPTITVIEPAENDINTSGTITLSGTVSDTGSGVAVNSDDDFTDYEDADDEDKDDLLAAANASYVVMNGETEVAKGLLEIDGASWTAGEIDLGDDEGTIEITVTIKDEVGQSREATRTFYYDKALPVISETGVGSNLTTGTAFTFSGTASDTNALYAVNASGVAKNAITVSATKADGTAAFTDKTIDVAAADDEDTPNGWSIGFKVGSSNSSQTNYLADGTYSFTFTVKDVAGRTKATTSTVTIDTVAPTVTYAEGTSFITDTPVNNLYKKEFLPLKATVTDNSGGTGIAMVEYAVISNPASAPNDTAWAAADWNTMTKGASNTYSASAQVESKANYIRIRATDAAGNVTYKPHETAQTDQNPPELDPTTQFALDSENPSWDGDLLSDTTFGGVGDYTEFTIKQKAKDENGIQKVAFIIDNDAEKTYTKTTKAGTEGDYDVFTCTIEVDSLDTDLNHKLEIKVWDNADRTASLTYTFKVDNDAPTVDVTNYSEGDRVKGAFYVAGTTQDAPQYNGATTLLYKVTGSAEIDEDDDDFWDLADNGEYGAHRVKSSNLAGWRIYFDNDVPANLLPATENTHDWELARILADFEDIADGEEEAYNEYLTYTNGKVVYSKDKDGHTAGTPFEDLTTVYIHFKATDALGNVNDEFVRSLSLDPQGAIPTVEIAYPEVSGYGWWRENDDDASLNDIIYTADKLPEEGDSAYGSLSDLSLGRDPDEITAVSVANKTITVDGKTYTFYAGETVQGGIVRVQGIAEDESAVSKVYLQIDPTYNPADGFDWSGDGDALLPSGAALSTLSSSYPIVDTGSGVKAIEASGTSTWSFNINRNYEFDHDGTPNRVAIRAVAKDAENHLSPLSDIIVLSIDSDTPRIGKSESLYLYQYANNEAGTGNVTASVKYEDGMWLKGMWWLVGSVEDSNDISNITVTDGQTGDGTEATSTAGWTTAKTYTNAETNEETHGYQLKFKIGCDDKDKFGSLSYTIFATDTDTPAKSVQKNIKVNYDNKAPELLERTNSSGTANSGYGISTEVVQSNGFYTLKSQVMEAASDSGLLRQSGFERLALYFVRPGTAAGKGYLYDTFLVKAHAKNKLTIDVNTSTGAAQNSTELSYEDGLYWKTQTVTRDTTPNNLNKFTLATDDANIHVGGLVKIGGAMYVITAKNATAITISGSPAIENTSVKFAMAHIVDNTLSEKNGQNLGANGYYTDIDFDDGDGMLESVATQGTTTYWEANINSRNIPDGNIEIHYVAFDKAGNYATGVVACDAEASYKGPEGVTSSKANVNYYDYSSTNPARVANNAPRLAGVKYGTDDDGDGNVTGTELKKDLFAMTEPAQNVSGGYETGKNGLKFSYTLGTVSRNQETNVVTISDSKLKIKGAMKIIPEIIGGNGNLYYSWSLTKNGASSAYHTVSSTAIEIDGNAVEGTDYSGTGAYSEITENAAVLFDMNTLLGAIDGEITTEEDKTQLFTFKVIDSTEGMGEGAGQAATLEMVATFEMQDTIKPHVYIKPFWWKSKTANSVGKDSSGNLTGHIDLSDDLPGANFTASGTGVYDLDDKVSGTIIIEGTANDNILVNEFYMRLFTGTADHKYTFPRAAAYSSTAAAVELSPKNAAGTPVSAGNFYKVATHNADGTWTTYGDLDSNGWKFEITGSTADQENGNTVSWKLTLNTEGITGVAETDVKIAVMALDRGSPTLSEGGISYAPNTSDLSADKTSGDTTETQTNLNQFDVVPYITEVSTQLSSLKKKNPTVYNRTVKGHYPVSADETVTFVGYNLSGAKYTETVDQTPVETTLGSADQLNDYYTKAGTSSGTLSMTKVSSSRGIELTVNDVPTLNNLNVNEAKGTAVNENNEPITLTKSNYGTYAYNRRPNGDNNLELTDDVFFDVWTLNTKAAVANDEGSINEPVMAINPKDGTIGLAFASGASNFSMPNGGTTSYSLWSSNYADFSNIALVYDDSGYAWTIANGLDTNDNGNDSYYAGRLDLMSSLWGRSTSYTDAGDNFHNSNKMRLESIGLPKGAKAFGVTKVHTQLDTKRFRSPALAVSTHGNTRGFYLAYYDRLTGQIRFRSGSSSSATKNGNSYQKRTGQNPNYQYEGTYFGQFIDAWGTTYNNQTAHYIGHSTNGYGNHGAFESTTEWYSLIAGGEADETGDIPSTGFTAGAYVALDVIPGASDVSGDVVLCVFFDGSDLWYVTRTGGVGADENVNKASVGRYWSKPVQVFEGIGENCTVKAGPDGSVHIACYDRKEGALKYAYMASATDTANMKTATIDGYGIAGSHIDIDVVKKDGEFIPYLSYYVPSIQKVKMAYLLGASALTSSEEGALNGADEDDEYTGVWECAIIPTASSVNDDNTSIGFWKNTSGDHKYEAQVITQFDADSATGEEGKCSGNGTANPVIAYGTMKNTSGYIEVAQMK